VGAGYIKGLKIGLTCTRKSPLAPLCPPGQAPPRLPARRVLQLGEKGSCPGGRPYGPAAKEGCFTSLWYLFPAESRQREVRRDFIEQCRYYYETVYKSEGVNFFVAYFSLKRPDSFPLIIS